MKHIYLDNHTITNPSAAAVDAMLPYLKEFWGTPSAPHLLGQELLPILEQAYRSIYQALGVGDENTVIFTSSGAEAINHVVTAVYWDVTRPTGKNHFVTSQIDEAPSILSMGRLEQIGCSVKMASVSSEGKVTAKAISEALSPRTALVSLSYANAMTGVVHEIEEIAQICQTRGVLFHLDISYVLGKLFFDIGKIKPDFMTLNGDVIHAPRATGALYMRSGLKVSPFILGGSEQAGQRAGSINLASLMGFAVAARELVETQDLLCTETARLRDKLEAGIKKIFPEAVIFYQTEERLPNCSTIGFPGVANDALLFALNRKGVFASFGGGNFQKISFLLSASGVDELLANSAIHFSLSRDTHEEEIDQAIEIIGNTALKLRILSYGVVS